MAFENERNSVNRSIVPIPHARLSSPDSIFVRTSAMVLETFSWPPCMRSFPIH